MTNLYNQYPYIYAGITFLKWCTTDLPNRVKNIIITYCNLELLVKLTDFNNFDKTKRN